MVGVFLGGVCNCMYKYKNNTYNSYTDTAGSIYRVQNNVRILKIEVLDLCT